MLQYWFEILAEFDVPPEAFEPSPKVHSMVVTLVPRPQPLCPVDDLNVMKRLVRASFQQRRKTLRNSLQQGTGLQEAQVLAALEACGISPKERPEQLSIEQFGALANVVSRQGLALPPTTPSTD
jgi:16S rRNA (adenine1518-N6/adenine1519-N6)-dimethyltransferase